MDRLLLLLCQPRFDELGAMGGLPALVDSGADKLPLAPVNSAWTKQRVPKLEPGNQRKLVLCQT